ncbi:MAG: inorganic diphosphatase [Clostridiales bacterium]|nr:inorganic diphosphatase [Clostridiales bacterium]
MNIWHNISDERITSKNFEALIEIPKGCKAKYELDKETGFLKLDRVLFTSTVYPANYGFIPKTLAEDGDPLDVLVLCGETIYPMTLVNCYPIGVIKMIDNGSLDEKIIAIPFSDPTYNSYYDVHELPKHVFDEMMHFFEVYKALEHKQTTVKEICHRDEAVDIINKCLENYKNEFCKKQIFKGKKK